MRLCSKSIPCAIIPLVSEVISDSTLKLDSTLTNQVAQVLEIVASGDAEPAHKVLGCGLEVAVVLLGLLLWSSEVGV